jgi:hypothetical protein
VISMPRVMQVRLSPMNSDCYWLEASKNILIQTTFHPTTIPLLLSQNSISRIVTRRKAPGLGHRGAGSSRFHFLARRTVLIYSPASYFPHWL